jgi:hypothetical protein
MSAINPGDTVRYVGPRKVTKGDELLVLAVYEDRFWGKTEEGKPLTYKMSDYEKVEPFFEAGKTYNCVGDTFEVRYVEEDGSGPVAIGILTSPSHRKGIWVTKRPNVFSCWDEDEVEEF